MSDTLSNGALMLGRVLMAALFQTRQPVAPHLRAFDDTGLQRGRFPTGWAGVLGQLA